MLKTLAAALAVMSCYVIEADAQTHTYNFIAGTIQTFTVPTDGVYDITAFGAQGGQGNGSVGGPGGLYQIPEAVTRKGIPESVIF
jgi:hypothetical protein